MDTPPIPNSPPASDNQDKSWAGKKLTLGWWIGIIAMAVFCGACHWKGTRIEGVIGAYAAGQIAGGIISPLFITALFAVFSYFRKAPRRLAVVAMIMFGLFGIFGLPSLQKRAHEADEWRALEKFIEPISAQSRARATAQQDFIDGDIDWARKYANTKETLALGRERLARLIQQDKLFLQTADSIMAKTAAMIKNNDTSLGISMDGLKSFYSSYGRKSQSLKNVTEANARLFARIDDALAMMQTEWGRWSKRPEGTSYTILWDNNELLEKFNAIYHDIVTLSAQLDDAEKAMPR